MLVYTRSVCIELVYLYQARCDYNNQIYKVNNLKIFQVLKIMKIHILLSSMLIFIVLLSIFLQQGISDIKLEEGDQGCIIHLVS